MKQFNRADAERLVQTYSDLILRLAYTYLKSTHDAEDICQNIFLKLLTGGQTFDSPAHEKAWIIRATANACKDSLRAAHPAQCRSGSRCRDTHTCRTGFRCARCGDGAAAQIP